MGRMMQSPHDNMVGGDTLSDAFEAAWLSALEAQMIDAQNIASAPVELFRAVLVSLETPYEDAKALGRIAFLRWRAEIPDAALALN